MKESFSQLYTRLYNENMQELETLRANEKKKATKIVLLIIACYFIAAILSTTIFFGAFIILVIAGAVIALVKYINSPKKEGPTYESVFKEKIITPLIENVFEDAKYDSYSGITKLDYNQAGYNDYYDIYNSEDLIQASLNVGGKKVTTIKFAEVHTQKVSKDSDGDRHYVTVFRGLAGSYNLSKNLDKKIYIRHNWRVSNWNKNKVKMDMPEFEKIFDVESDDAILTMRILTADVMAEMIDLYKKYKYMFEINILEDKVYMRLRTGAVFEPSVFKSAMEYKQIEKYYLVLRAMMNIASHVYDTVDKLDM